MEQTSDLFISYSKQDLKEVEPIVQCMTSYGASCWFQLKDSKQAFATAIIDGINSAKAFVVFLSDASVKSIFVQNEIACAIEKLNEDSSYKILPVVLENTNRKSHEFKALNVFLATFNMLSASDYASTNELTLKIFEQVGLSFHETESAQSIYNGDSSVETQRLVIQTRLYNLYAQRYIDEIFGSVPTPAVLDVGCSNGNTVMSRIKDKPYSLLVGIDNNEHKINEAKTLYPEDKNSFYLLDLSEKNLRDDLLDILKKYGKTGFDLIHVSAVLLHIKSPKTLLTVLHDLLNPGGYIFIQEEDDGLNLVYPETAYFKNCFFIYDHSLESGDRTMGRKVPLHLKNAGFRDIQLKSATISSLDIPEGYREDLWDFYFNPHYWDATSASYFDDIRAVDLLPSLFSSHEKNKSAYLSGKVFLMMGVTFYTAQK